MVIYAQNTHLSWGKLNSIQPVTGDFLRKEQKSLCKFTSENLKTLKFYHEMDSLLQFFIRLMWYTFLNRKNSDSLWFYWYWFCPCALSVTFIPTFYPWIKVKDKNSIWRIKWLSIIFIHEWTFHPWIKKVLSVDDCNG